MAYQYTYVTLSQSGFPEDGSSLPALTIARAIDVYAKRFEAKGRTSNNPNISPEDLENVFAIASLMKELGIEASSEISEIKYEEGQLKSFSPAIAMAVDGESFVLKYGAGQEWIIDPDLFDRNLALRMKGSAGNREAYGVSIGFESGGFSGTLPVPLKKNDDTMAKVKFFNSIEKGRHLKDIRDAIAPSRPSVVYDSQLPIGTVLKIGSMALISKDCAGGVSIPQLVFLLEDERGLTLDRKAFGNESLRQLNLLGDSSESGVLIQSLIKVDITAEIRKDGTEKLRNDGTPWMRSVWVAPSSKAHENMVLQSIAQRKSA